MTPLQSRSLTALLAPILAAAALALCGSARAATLVANPESVATTLSSNITSTVNTLDVVNLPPAAVKISGDGNFTKSNASTGTIAARIQGQINVQQNEQFATDYDFTFTLTGTGQVTWELKGEVRLSPFPYITVFTETSPAPLLGPGTQLYTGSGLGTIPNSLNGDFRATVMVTWTGGGIGDTLTINVPNNSIDLAIIPEPTSIALIGIAGMGLLSRRRR